MAEGRGCLAGRAVRVSGLGKRGQQDDGVLSGLLEDGQSFQDEDQDGGGHELCLQVGSAISMSTVEVGSCVGLVL